jgi:nucleotidyltransferase/DNA polymerase involved in DNA repair
VIIRIVCLLAPHLPLQVERQQRGQAGPLIITHPVQAEVVWMCSAELASGGVQPGMSLHQAQRLVPEAIVAAADELAYHAAHAALEAALRRFSPVIETVGLGEFLADARGLPDDQLAELLNAAQAASELMVGLGAAAGKFTAQQAAKAAGPGHVRSVAPGEEARFLAPLAIAVLPYLPGELRRRLHLLDLHTLGDLAALRKPAVLRQFGGEMSGLYELARGDDPRPLNPDVPPLRVVRSLRLAEPVAERGVLLNVTQRLSRQVSSALSAHGYHAEALKLTLAGADGRRWEAGQALKPPTSDEARLGRLAAQLLGRLTPATPVEAVIVGVYPLRSWHLGAHQVTLAEAGVPAKQRELENTLQLLMRRFGEAVIRVAALLGPPVPLKVQVSLDTAGLPARLDYGGRARVVLALDEAWREERSWWERPVRRDYFRVVLGDGTYRNVFQDLVSGDWFIDRAWPLL